MSQNQAQLVQQLHDHVVAKSLQDPAFRAALIADPRAAVEKEFNAALPAGFNLNVVESPANTMTVVLPHVSARSADGELSDADLEAVAGGSKSGATDFFNKVGDATGITGVVNDVTRAGQTAATIGGIVYDNRSAIGSAIVNVNARAVGAGKVC